MVVDSKASYRPSSAVPRTKNTEAKTQCVSPAEEHSSGRGKVSCAVTAVSPDLFDLSLRTGSQFFGLF